MNILVVDDTPIVRDTIKSLLEQSGHNVELAENGMRALILIEKENKRFDLIITDYSMTVLNGIGVIFRVRSIVPDARIWLVSALLHDHIAKKALELGAEKAINKGELSQALKEAGIIA